MELPTHRLRLLPLAPEHLLALLAGPDDFARAFGHPAAEGLGDFMTSGDVSPEWLAALRAARGVDFWRDGFGLLRRSAGDVIGCVMFKGPPAADGMVEIAYGIVPSCQNQGYATEAAAAQVAFAEAQPGVRVVRAHTLPVANASTRVLAKCGFAFRGETIVPEDGAVWRWEHPAIPQ
jgi:[ribosomal protein S5]-alanine N-acetyltransferase